MLNPFHHSLACFCLKNGSNLTQKYVVTRTLHPNLISEERITIKQALICWCKSFYSSRNHFQKIQPEERWWGQEIISDDEALFQFIPQVLDGVEVGALCRRVNQTGKTTPNTPNLWIYFFINLAMCARASSSPVSFQDCQISPFCHIPQVKLPFSICMKSDRL